MVFLIVQQAIAGECARPTMYLTASLVDARTTVFNPEKLMSVMVTIN